MEEGIPGGGTACTKAWKSNSEGVLWEQKMVWYIWSTE